MAPIPHHRTGRIAIAADKLDTSQAGLAHMRSRAGPIIVLARLPSSLDLRQQPARQAPNSPALQWLRKLKNVLLLLLLPQGATTKQAAELQAKCSCQNRVSGLS